MEFSKPPHVSISQLAIEEIKPAANLSTTEKNELLFLLKSSYPHYEHAHIFDNYPSYEQLYVYQMRINQTLVASRQFLIVNDISQSPVWAKEMSDLLELDRFAIGSRAIVHPHLRGHGFGSKLVQAVNRELYSNHEVPAIFGSSTNIAAISLYMRHGAKLWQADIKRMNTFVPAQLRKNHGHNRMPSPMRYIYWSDRQHNHTNNITSLAQRRMATRSHKRTRLHA